MQWPDQDGHRWCRSGRKKYRGGFFRLHPRYRSPRDRPSTTSEDVFSTQGGHTLGHWLAEIAGGNYVAKDLQNHFIDVSIEQVIAWNSDVIIVGGMIPGKRSLPTHGGKQYAPSGKTESMLLLKASSSSHGSSELPLFVMWLAKTLHPKRFSNINLEQERRDNYSRFYRY
jgi:iron complex transport system substrate-binding protein